MLNAIILAGEQPIKNWGGTGSKALFRINGKMMIDYVIDALKNVDDIGKIVVIGPGNELKKCLGERVDAIIDSNGSIMQNIMAGIKSLGCDNKLLVCTADIPLITPAAVKDFIAQAKALDADLCYPIVEKRVNDEKYPEAERTYVKIKEGVFAGGNVFYVNPCVMGKGLETAEKLLGVRKKPLKMARLLGFGFMVQLLLGTLTISKVEKRLSSMLNIKGRAVISKFPEISNDVDKATDVIVVTAHLSK